MSLLKFLKPKKTEIPEIKQEFIDENLTPEEIDEKLWPMNFSKQSKYLHEQISPKQFSAFVKYVGNKMKEEATKNKELSYSYIRHV